MGAQQGNRTRLPRMADVAEAITAGHTDVTLMAATFKITVEHMKTRLREAGYDPETGHLRVTPKPAPYKRAIGDEPVDWLTGRACAESDPELFHATDKAGIEAAKEVCAGCPVRVKCLDWTLRIEGDAGRTYRFGVFGALTGDERAKIAGVA